MDWPSVDFFLCGSAAECSSGDQGAHDPRVAVGILRFGLDHKEGLVQVQCIEAGNVDQDKILVRQLSDKISPIQNLGAIP